MASSTSATNPEVIQFRYYGIGSSENYPSGEELWTGGSTTSDTQKSVNLLSNYGSAVKIGIQTLPGVKFYIGNSSFTTGITIDHTGVYELDLRNTTTSISSLYFNMNSLKRIDEMGNASLIVDVLYNPASGTVSA